MRKRLKLNRIASDFALMFSPPRSVCQSELHSCSLGVRAVGGGVVEVTGEIL